jgi:hypothetical protein
MSDIPFYRTQSKFPAQHTWLSTARRANVGACRRLPPRTLRAQA